MANKRKSKERESWIAVAERLSPKTVRRVAKEKFGGRYSLPVEDGESRAKRVLGSVKPTSNALCLVCSSPFYAAPSHIKNGWAKTCSFKCRSEYKPNPRFIENDIACKNCGKLFHVKPSAQRANKNKKYCSVDCRNKATKAKKICPKCKKEFTVPKSHEHKTKYCSNKCFHESALCFTPNKTCVSCGKKFYIKPYEIKRNNSSGTFCSVACMTGSRGKKLAYDGMYISHLEEQMLSLLKSSKLEFGMVREYKFHPIRKWRLDFAWPDKKIGIEVHGGVWSGKFGGHTSGAGRIRDMEKMNEAVILGWSVIEVTSVHLKNGMAIDWAKKLLGDLRGY